MKQKLIELLKTVPEIKKDIEELKWCCEVEYVWAFKQYWSWIYYLVEIVWCWAELYRPWEMSFTVPEEDFEVIWNPLEERHLRVYCTYLNKWTYIWIDSNWVYTLEAWFDKFIVELDNTKSFNDQTDEVYGKIVEFLEV